MMRTIMIWLILMVSSSAFSQPNPFKDAEIPIDAFDKIRYRNRFSKPSVRFLMAVYGNMKYPAGARKMEAMAILRVDYTVLSSGEVRIDTVMQIMENQLPEFSDQLELIRIKGYLVPYVESSHGRNNRKKVRRKNYTLIQRIFRKTYGRILIEKEVYRVFSTLPRHQPATFCGSPINWSYTRYLKFELE